MPFFGAFDSFVCLIEKRVEVSEYFQHYLDGLLGWFEKYLDKSRILDDFRTFQTVSKIFLVKFKKGRGPPVKSHNKHGVIH